MGIAADEVAASQGPRASKPIRLSLSANPPADWYGNGHVPARFLLPYCFLQVAKSNIYETFWGLLRMTGEWRRQRTL